MVDKSRPVARGFRVAALGFRFRNWYNALLGRYVLTPFVRCLAMGRVSVPLRPGGWVVVVVLGELHFLLVVGSAVGGAPE